MATDKQIDYLEKLFIDCGFASRLQRNDFISLRVKRAIKYLGDLTIQEASKIIDDLKELKEENWEKEARARDGS